MPIQLQVHDCKQKRIALCCTRRAGKSYLAAPWFVEEGMKSTRYDRVDFFIAPTLEHAKSLLWGHLRELKRKTGLNFEMKNDPASVIFPSGARLIFRGAKDLDDLGSLVGYPTGMLWVDECQDIRDEVLKFVQNKVGPALRDMHGRMVFSGTPGRVAAGLWYEIATGKRTNWTTFGWSLFDNEHLPPESRDLQLILQEEGYTPATPAFKREYMGMWVEDDSLLCYKYDPQLNGQYTYGQSLPDGHDWTYVIGVDFGYSPDPSAVVALAYSNTHPAVFVVDEFRQTNKTYTDLYELGVRPMYEKYGPCVVVGDAASPQAIAEINQRWSIGMQPCTKGNKKTLKASYMELMNADFIRGRIHVPPESAYAHELAELVWDPDKLPERKEHPRRANHLCDAGLYAYICAKHWNQQPREPIAPLVDSEQQYGWDLAQYAREQTSRSTLIDWCDDAQFGRDLTNPWMGKRQ